LRARRRSCAARARFLFVDEIHRWNKAQQDALLPYVERGSGDPRGRDDRDPSFAVNAALLSRARVFKMEPLPSADVRALLDRALADADRGLGGLKVTAAPDALDAIASMRMAMHDARSTCSKLAARDAHSRSAVIDRALVAGALASPSLRYARAVRALQRRQRVHQVDARQRSGLRPSTTCAHAGSGRGSTLRLAAA